MERRIASEGSSMRLEELEGDILAERFRLERMVGQGGYGAVFEATQLSVGRRCAVKIMLPGRSTNESVEERFRDEARATSRLTHPNSIVLYDFGIDEKSGFLFLATEFLDGATLHEVLKAEKTLEVRRAVSIMKQVAASLQDAHSLGLVHRDIKPNNIMLIERAGTTDFVKVIDFGIVKALRGQLSRDTDLTCTGMLIGTPKYMAPEQILGKEMDRRVDQYVLGVVGYRMLTGRNPFRAGAPMETAMRHVNDRVLPLRSYRPELEVSAEFEDAFMRALEKSPEYRFEQILDFVNALEESMDERICDATHPQQCMGEDAESGMEATASKEASQRIKTTEKLGAVLQARAGDGVEPGVTLQDTGEGGRTTASVILDPGLAEDEEGQQVEEGDDVDGFDGPEEVELLREVGLEGEDNGEGASSGATGRLPADSVPGTQEVSTEQITSDEGGTDVGRRTAMKVAIMVFAAASLASLVAGAVVMLGSGSADVAQVDSSESSPMAEESPSERGSAKKADSSQSQQDELAMEAAALDDDGDEDVGEVPESVVQGGLEEEDGDVEEREEPANKGKEAEEIEEEERTHVRDSESPEEVAVGTSGDEATASEGTSDEEEVDEVGVEGEVSQEQPSEPGPKPEDEHDESEGVIWTVD